MRRRIQAFIATTTVAVCAALATAAPADASWYRAGYNGCSAPQDGSAVPACTGAWSAYAYRAAPSCPTCTDVVYRWTRADVPANAWIYDAPYPGTTEWRWVYVWGAPDAGWRAMRTTEWSFATYWARRAR